MNDSSAAREPTGVPPTATTVHSPPNDADPHPTHVPSDSIALQAAVASRDCLQSARRAHCLLAILRLGIR